MQSNPAFQLSSQRNVTNLFRASSGVLSACILEIKVDNEFRGSNEPSTTWFYNIPRGFSSTAVRSNHGWPFLGKNFILNLEIFVNFFFRNFILKNNKIF